MSKNYGEITVKAGKEVVNLRKIINQIVNNSKDPTIAHDDKISFIKKKNNLLLARVQKSKNKYVSSVNNLNNDEINTAAHEENLRNFNLIIGMAEEIKGLESNKASDYENVINRYI